MEDMRENGKSKLRTAAKLSDAEVYQELRGISERLQHILSAIPRDVPKDISLYVAGSLKFLQMAQQELLERDAQLQRFLAQQIPRATPVLQSAKQKNMFGFGGNCFAAAIAINEVLFEGKLSYLIAANAAFRDAGRTIGHATVFYKDFDGMRHHFDADGRVKLDVDVETWGMLDREDLEYIESAQDLGIEWSDEAAHGVAMLEVTDAQLRELTNDAEVQATIEILRQAARQVDAEADCEAELTL